MIFQQCREEPQASSFNVSYKSHMFFTNIIPRYRRFSTYYFGSNPVSIVSNAEMKTTNILPQLQHDQDPKILQILPLRTVVMPYLSAGSNAGGPITTLSKVSQQISRCRSFTTSLVIVISDPHRNGFPKLFQHGESRMGKALKTYKSMPATIARIIQGIIMTIINGQLGGWPLHQSWLSTCLGMP